MAGESNITVDRGGATTNLNDQTHINNTQPVRNANFERRQSHELTLEERELRKAKRKSNAYMAAEAVQQERDAVRTLKRLSMGGSLTVDPDLPYGVDNELEYQHNKQRRWTSSGSSISSSSSTTSSSSSSGEEIDVDKTLIDDASATPDSQDSSTSVDAEKLLWVPAKSHPSIAPDQFRRHVQVTLGDMTKSTKDSRDNSESMPSLKELTDELDKITEMAGLAATDAVTLARSLSSASSSSSLLYPEENDDNSPPSPTSDSNASNTSEDEMDQDSPILLDSSSSLKRNKWTTYSRSRRMNTKDKQTKPSSSPLISESSTPEKILPDLNKELPPDPSKESSKPRHRPQPLTIPRSNSDTIKVSGKNEPELARAQSESSSPKRTNHTRNRHAGSLINIESNTTTSTNSKEPISFSSHKTPQPQSIEHQRKISPLSSSPINQSYSSNIHENRYSPTESHHIDSTQITDIVKDGKKESKSKDFLNIFKMKRSPSPKTLKESVIPKKKGTPLSPNEENIPFDKSDPSDKGLLSPESERFHQQQFQKQQQQQQYQQQHQHNLPQKDKQHLQYQQQQRDKQHHYNQQQEHQQQEHLHSNQRTSQRPSLKSSAFKFSKSKDESRQHSKGYPNHQQQHHHHHQHQHQQQSQQQQQQHHHSQHQYPSPGQPSHEQRTLQGSVNVIPRQTADVYRTGDPRAKQKKQRSSTSKQSQHTLQEELPIQPTSSPEREQQQSSNTTTEQSATGLAQHKLQKESLEKKLSIENLKKSKKANAPVQFTESAFGFPLPPLSHSTIIMLDYRFPIHVERALYRLSHLKLANPRRPLRQQVLLSNFMYAYLNLVNHTLYLQQLSEEGSEEVLLDANNP